MLVWMFVSTISSSQDISSLPVVAFPAKNFDAQKGFVLYLSGDGGENTFSKSFTQQLVSSGYPVVFFNSLKYFWTKKTPQQAAADVEKLIGNFKTQWKSPKVIIVAYSFGADVAPFLLTRFSKETFTSIKNVVLMSPSKTTDFEVHVTELFGKGKNTGMSVGAELNKMLPKPLLIVSGEDESNTLDPAILKIAYKAVRLKGGHRYDSNTAEVASTILRSL